MATYGDNYSWTVSFATDGASAATQAVETVKAMGKATDAATAAVVAQNRAYVQARDERGRFIKGTTDAADAQRRLANEAERAAGKLGRGSGGMGQAMLQFAQLADDAQYGVRGILNNIPSLAMALGGGAGLAGAISLVALGVDQLIRRAPALAEMFSGEEIQAFGATVSALRRELDELTKKEYRLEVDSTAVDDARDKLNQAEAALKAFETLSKQQTSLQSEAAKRAGEAIVEFGGGDANTTGADNLQRAVRDLLMSDPAMVAERRQAEAAATAARADAQAFEADPNFRFSDVAQRDELLRRQARAAAAEQALRGLVARQSGPAEAAAAGMVGGAGRGDDAAIVRLLNTIQGNAGFFGQRGIGGDFLQALQGARPGAVAADRRAEEEKKQAAEIERLEAEIKAVDDKAAREKEAAERKAQQEAERADAERERAAEQAAQPFIQGAGQGVEEALRAGASPEQAALELNDQLRQLGYTIEEAFGLATRVTEEVNARVQAAMQAERVRAMQMLRGQNPWRNNRPNGL